MHAILVRSVRVWPQWFRAAAAVWLFLAAATLARGANPTPGNDVFSPFPTGVNTLEITLGNGADGEAIAFNPMDQQFYHSSGNGTLVFERLSSTPPFFPVVNIPLSGPKISGETFGLVWYPPIGRFLRTDISSQLSAVGTDGVTSAAIGTITDLDQPPVETDLRGLALVGPRVFGTSSFQNKLLEIDPSNAKALSTRTVVLDGGAFTPTGFTALTHDPVTKSIYGIAKVSAVTGRVLVLVDVRSATAKTLGNTGNNFAALTVRADGKVFGVTGTGAFTNPETLFSFARAAVFATEESALQSFEGLLTNDIDPDPGDTLNTMPGPVQTSPLGASFQILGGGQFTYDPSGSAAIQGLAQDELGLDTFAYTVTDQTGATATGNVTVQVLGMNDAPVVDLDGPGGTQNFRAAPVILDAPAAVNVADADAAISDVDASDRIFSLTATLGGVLDGANEVLAATPSGGADTVVFVGNVLTVTASTGSAPAADFVAVLRSITFQDNSATPTLGQRAVTVQVSDGLEFSAVATSAIGVTTRPTLTLPNSPVIAEATSPSGAAVTFAPTANDTEDGALTPVSVPASGSAFPIGDTLVSVTATDGDGAVATGSFTVRVRDTTPPTIGGQFSPLIFFVGTLPDFRGQAVKSDLASTPTVTQSPQEGSATNVGLLPVTLTAEDGAGNTATTNFTVDVRPLAAVNTKVIAQGDLAPGVGTNGLPVDAKLASFGGPATSDAGDLAFLAKWTSGAKVKGSGLFLNGTCLGIVGGDAPIAGAKYKSFTDPVTDGGHVACIAGLTGASKPPATVVLSNAAGGPLEVIAQVGGTATADGAKFAKFKAVDIADGYAAVFASLSAGTGTTPKTSAANDLGLWVKDGNGPLTLALREGQTVAGKVVKTLVSFAPGAGSPGQGRGWLRAIPAIGGQVMALALFADKSQGVVVVDADDIPNPIVLSLGGQDGDGSPDLPNASFASYSFPALARNDASAFLASLTVGAGGVVKGTERGIFHKPALTGDYAALVRQGDAAVSGAKFSVLKDPVLSDDGGMGFSATIKGGTVKGLAATTLWFKPPGSAFDLLAQGGAPAAEVTGAQWKAFTSLAIAANRGPIFAGTLVTKKGVVTAASANAVWACDFNRDPRLLFRTGIPDAIVVGKTLKSFTLLKASAGSTGVTRSFNDAAEVVWLATFTDKTQAVIRTVVP